MVITKPIYSRCICVIERAGISVYSYMGRLLATPRCGSRPETLGRAAVSLGPDSFAMVDQNDRKSEDYFILDYYVISCHKKKYKDLNPTLLSL